MQIIKKSVPRKVTLKDALISLEVDSEALVLPKTRKDSVYSTISQLKKGGNEFITEINGKEISIWRTK